MKRKTKMSKAKKKTRTILKVVANKSAYVSINMKVSKHARDLIQKLADQYARGNMTAWLKYAGTEMKPRKKDVTKAAA